MPRTPERRRAENWDHWLYIHHLDMDFPTLHPISDDEFEWKFFEREKRAVVVSSIVDAVLGSPRTQIQFAAGHGVTTTFNAVLRRLNDYEPIRRIPIPIDVARYGADDLTEALWRDIREVIFRELVATNRYERLYGNRKQMFQTLFDTQGFTSFKDYIDSTKQALEGPARDPARLRSALDSFRYGDDMGAVGALLQVLFGNLAIETFLLFDIPSNAPVDTLLVLMSEIKKFDETVRAQPEFPPAAVSEAYFGTAASHDEIRATYARDYYRVPVPPYNRAEAFAILTNHYGNRDPNRRFDSVATILSASYLDDVWKASKSLAGMMEDLKASLLSHLDIPRDRVSYGMFQDPPRGRL